MSFIPSSSKRLLCVDDHEDSCDMLINLLSDYEVTPASTSADGLRLARSDRFDLILLEHRLPDGGGADLCSQIRKFKPRIPILFFTAAAYSSDRQHGLMSGAQDYLMKPDDLELLAPTIGRLIHEAEAGVVG